jgi:hypothetical protein
VFVCVPCACVRVCVCVCVFVCVCVCTCVYLANEVIQYRKKLFNNFDPVKKNKCKKTKLELNNEKKQGC